VPVAAWSAYAIAVFGHIVSQSVAAKHAQLLYGGTSYLPGLLSRTAHVYAALVPVRFVRSLVVPAIASGVILLLFARRGRTVYGYCALWALAVTALYVVVQVPFYYWFAMQVPVIAAVAGGGLLWDAFPSDGARIAARCVGAFIVCATLLSFVTLLARPQLKYTEIDSMLVLPHIARNPYFMLATWLRENTAPQDSVAYPEIGQLRYYSGRPVVDYEGLSTPGVVARMLQGNMIWAFERYRPSVYVQREGSWSFLVDPLEFEWFGRAYARVKTLRYDLDGHRQTFVIYRLKSRAVVPAPEEIDVRGAASVVASSAGSAQVQVVPSVRGVNALEMRVAGACARGRMSVLRRGDLLAQRTVHFAGATHRLRIAFAREADSAGMPYRVVLNGCQGIRLAPPLRLRTGLQLYTNAVRTVGRPADALAVYWRP
jgi:hypothetical protein